MRITTLLLFVLAIFGIAYSQNPKPAQPVIQSGMNGRYQIVMNPELARNTFLLDTQTGQTWQLTQYPGLQGEPTAWTFKAKLDSEGEMMAWATTQGLKK